MDWPALLDGSTLEVVVPKLSVRGKNLLFLDQLAGALQLDDIRGASIPEFKRAFTPEAVRKIFEATAIMWTGTDDLTRGLRSEAEKSSALYVGRYDVGRILQGVTRHSLYAERILLIDPFIHPFMVRDEYNPILHPEEHAQTALKWAWLWLLMAPWIEADLVHFVRKPEDFDSELFFKAAEVTERRYKDHPELEAAARRTAESEPEILEQYGREVLLRAPDWHLRGVIEQALPQSSKDEVNDIIESFRTEREKHPFVLEPPQDGSFHDITQVSTGTSYEMAKWTASISGSHIVTDLPARWSEIELDYNTSGLEAKHWSPFAKALNGSDLRALNAVPLDAALRLREEGALQSMRDFFSGVWRTAKSDELFANANAEALSAELRHEVSVAEEEWKRIDRELVRWSTAELAAGLVASGPAVASGSGAFLAGGLAVAGLGNLVWSHLERRGFTNRHPAAFLLRLGSK